MPHILLIDDDERLGDLLERYFQRFDFQLQQATLPSDGLSKLAQGGFDLIILDIMLPEMDGFDVCREIRKHSDIPIIMLTGRGEVMDRVIGLELGADDYLCKPFSMRELIARIRVLFRRLDLSGSEATRNLIEVGPLRLDLDRHTAGLGGTPLNLTVTEFLILAALARRPGVVKTRAQLMEEGYPYDTLVAERTIDTHVKRLRKKLAQADPSGPELIETVYGLGYRLRSGR